MERLKVPYLIVGSFASIAYGEARFTQDIDIVVALESKDVAQFVASFPAPEFYLSEPAIQEAIRDSFQFNVIHSSSGNKIDFMLQKSGAWPALQMTRARRVRLFPDRDATVAAPEDVIIGKLWYYAEGGGDRHLRDIAGFSGCLVQASIALRLNVWRDNSVTWKPGSRSSKPSMATNHLSKAATRHKRAAYFD
jgi:hypothetical protein